MRISDWSSDVCSSDLAVAVAYRRTARLAARCELAARLSPAGAEPRFRESGDRRGAAPDRRRGVEIGGDRGKRACNHLGRRAPRSEEHTSELQSLMRISYAVFCLIKKKIIITLIIIYHLQ